MIDYRTQWRVILSFILASLIFILLCTLPIFGDQSYIQNPSLHLEVRQTIYWVSVFISFYILHKIAPNDLFSNMVTSLFGPVILMTVFFMRLFYKLFPIKVDE